MAWLMVDIVRNSPLKRTEVVKEEKTTWKRKCQGDQDPGVRATPGKELLQNFNLHGYCLKHLY